MPSSSLCSQKRPVFDLKKVRKARKAVSKVLPTGARMSEAVARVRVMLALRGEARTAAVVVVVVGMAVARAEE